MMGEALALQVFTGIEKKKLFENMPAYVMQHNNI